MRVVLLVVAAVVAIFAGVAALRMSAPAPDAPGQVAAGTPGADMNLKTVDVLVARSEIPAGIEITASMVDKQPWPEHLLLPGFISGPEMDKAIVGKVSRSAFQSREPLLASKLASKDDAGFMAASLPAGMRAITIATDAINGVAGFIFPGDRIDILFTHSIPDQGSGSAGGAGAAAAQNLINSLTGGAGGASPAAGGSASVAEVLAVNIPVLAINTREEPSMLKSAGSLIPGTEQLIPGLGGGGSVAPSSLTLQVTQEQAEKIRLAERVGSLSVSLRPLMDRQDSESPAPITLPQLTQVSLGASASVPTSSGEVKVVRGGASSQPQAPAGLLNFGGR